MASVGEVPYAWSIESDALVWGANATAVLKFADPASLATGRSYAKLLVADSSTSRFEAVMNSQGRDDGQGVPYQVQYALRTGDGDKCIWIEDNGRWFAGATARPARAHGGPPFCAVRYLGAHLSAYYQRNHIMAGPAVLRSRSKKQEISR